MRIPSPGRPYYRVGRSKTGLGLFATKPIKKGAFIASYRGRLIRTKLADELNTKYLFEINSRWTIDGATRKNIARYINHSCRPNAEPEIRRHAIHIHAKKNIRPGDEITYHYGRGYFDTFIKPNGCKCAHCAHKRKGSRPRRRRLSARRPRRTRS